MRRNAKKDTRWAVEMKCLDCDKVRLVIATGATADAARRSAQWDTSDKHEEKHRTVRVCLREATGADLRAAMLGGG